MTSPSRVFVARLARAEVFDPKADQVGRVRDVVVALRTDAQPPRVVGLVVEVVGRRRIFVPMSRVTAIDSGQVVVSGVVNLRRFQQRAGETLALGELLDRRVTLVDPARSSTPTTVTIVDLGIEQRPNRDWHVT
ncbi:MAG: PRC-barrel domain-containing protein, partial [Candidatus Nanopelagicales bacterium]